MTAAADPEAGVLLELDTNAEPRSPQGKAREDETCRRRPRRARPRRSEATVDKGMAKDPDADSSGKKDLPRRRGVKTAVLLLVATCLWLRFNAILTRSVTKKQESDDAKTEITATPLKDDVPFGERSASVPANDGVATTPAPTKGGSSPGVVDVMDDDPRCKLVLSGLFDPEEEFSDDDAPPETFSLGPCRYIYPQRVAPAGGWTKDIDWNLWRPAGEATSFRREECFVRCLELMERLPAAPKVTHDLLAAAAVMGLRNATRALVERHRLDPLYVPPDVGNFRPNAIQAAIMGGYAEVVKILTNGKIDLVIDEHGRTIRDYVRMAGSPIRPHYARRVLGIASPPNEPRRPEGTRSPDHGDGGWNATASVPVTDAGCDFDVIDSTRNDMSPDAFRREYYFPGRPVVLRNQVPPAELESFSKRSWSKLEHFHPSSPVAVGSTAYPNLTGQRKCSHDLTIEELERDVRCSDDAKLRMMHAEHDRNFDEAYAMYGGDPVGGANAGERAGFRALDWLGEGGRRGWQLFFGADGSGATLHWHAAAFNVLYVGMKEWRVTPPQYRGWSGMPADEVKAAIEDEPFTMKCTQIPGDLIYIPDYWGHMTLNHGFGIGVAVIVNAADRSVPGFIRNGKKGGKKNGKKVAEGTNAAGGAEEEKRSIPFFFVHINKAGGTSLISMLREHCTADEYVRERWETETRHHRSFHSTAHSYLARHGRRVWDEAFTFAVVRHPLARQVSNFFFLLGECEKNRKRCEGSNNDRLIPVDAIKSSSTDEEKINTFHKWMWNLYRAYPPGSPRHHLFGSKGHGNEEYPTMNATQTSWLVDETGRKIVVDAVFQLENLDENFGQLAKRIPCLAKAGAMVTKNKSPEYPHYSKFSGNERTNRIMREVYAVDYSNFAYDFI